MTNCSWRAPADSRPANNRFFVMAYLTKSTSRCKWKRDRPARASPIAAIAARSRSSPPRTNVIGAPCRHQYGHSQLEIRRGEKHETVGYRRALRRCEADQCKLSVGVFGVVKKLLNELQRT